jgi:hypothetical protein
MAVDLAGFPSDDLWDERPLSLALDVFEGIKTLASLCCAPTRSPDRRPVQVVLAESATRALDLSYLPGSERRIASMTMST